MTRPPRPHHPRPAPSSPDLGPLLVATAGGDKAAFAQLYDLIIPAVLGLARRVVRNPALAEEAAQEAMVQVWRQAPLFDPSRGSGRAWILTIAHRRAVDAVRREERRPATHLAAVEGDTPVEHDTADMVCDATVVGAALRTLTPLQREAITLTYLGGLSYPEAADLLQVPLGTMKTRIRDAVLAMRRNATVDMAV